MAEETLQRIQADLERISSEEELLRSKLDAEIAGWRQAAKEAAAEFEAWSAIWRAALDDATAAANASAFALDEKLSMQLQADGKLASMQEDIAAWEKAFQAHFVKPMNARKGPNLEEMQPFLECLELEKTLK